MQVRTTIAATAVAGLLVGATLGSPGLAQAARLITGHDIKNGSIGSADVRNHSLRAKDLRRGVLSHAGPMGPSGVVDAKFSAGASTLPTATLGFVAHPASVTVSAGQAVVVTSSAALGSMTSATSLHLAVCYDSGSGIAALGNGPTDLTASGLQLFSLSAVLTGLTPGTYDVGLCGSTNDNDWDRPGTSYTTAQVVTLPAP